MKTEHNPYELDDDFTRLKFDTLEKWLSATYWSPNIKAEEIRNGAKNSTLNVGCYLNSSQVGYLRLVSDKTRFAYIMDVFVDPEHRQKGIALKMVRFAIEHPDFLDVYQWVLATHDAHSVYEKAGFQILSNPERWMIMRKEKLRL